jgi:oxygen-dependent protoporphyrinogen oxidase
MSDYRKAIIIGAGIAGLTAAYQLRQRGWDISLLEREDRVGGVINSWRQDGFLLEGGPNSFLASPQATRLIGELGLVKEQTVADSQAPRYIYFHNKLMPVPMGPAFLFSSLMSLKGKLRIFAEPFIKARVDSGEESIGDFFRRRIGKEALDRLVAPFVSGVYAGNVEKLSLKASFPSLAEWEEQYGSMIMGAIRSRRKTPAASKNSEKEGSPNGKGLCSFNEGLSTLTNALAKNLAGALMRSCQIESISIGSQSPRYQIRCRQAGNSYEFVTDILIMATPAAPAAQLLGAHLPALADELNAIEYAPMAIVYLNFPARALAAPLNGFGFLAPRSEGLRLLGSVWSSSLFPARAPVGQTLLTNFIGGSHDPGAVDLSDEELIKIAGEELQRALAATSPPQAIGVRKLRRAIPQYTIGHAARVARIDDLLRAQMGLHLIGNYLRGVSVPDCIDRASDLAAQLVATAT